MSTKHVFAAIWPVNSISDTANKSLDVKFLRLTNAVYMAHVNCTEVAARLGISKPHITFAAPEYYFVKGVDLTDLRNQRWTLYEKDEKDAILRRLRDLSKDFPKVLIIPGSIAWRERRATPKASYGGRVNTHNGFNTTPILYRKKVLHSYDKKFDDGSCVDFTTDTTFNPGTGSQLFRFERLKCGIEVCGDMSSGNLSKEADAQSLDLEFYISATNPHDFRSFAMGSVPLRDGGYLVHCDATGIPEKNGVWLIQRGKGSHGVAVDLALTQFQKCYDPYSGTDLNNRIDSAGVGLGRSVLLQLDRKVARATVPAPPEPSPEPETEPEPTTRPRSHSAQLTQPMMIGRGRSGSVVAPENPAGLLLQLTDFVLTQALDGLDQYKAQLTVRLSAGPGVTANPANKVVRFTVDQHGTALPAHAATGPTGEARTVVTLQRKDTPIRVTATYAGASVTGEATFVPLGAGNASLLGQLHGTKYGQIPCWHLPLV